MHSESAHHFVALNDRSLGVDAFLELTSVDWSIRDGELLGLLVRVMSMPGAGLLHQDAQQLVALPVDCVGAGCHGLRPPACHFIGIKGS